MALTKILPLAVAAALCAPACVVEDTSAEQVDDLTSTAAVFLELSFKGQVIMEEGVPAHKAVEAQLFYLAGELDKTHGAHGRFGFVQLTDTATEELDGDLEKLTYEAKLPVAWPKNRAVPSEYRVIVPSHVDAEGLDAFNEKYAHVCGKAKYGEDTLWYDFKPLHTEGCELAPEDVLDTMAGVRQLDPETKRYPELDKIWEDGQLRIVMVHGTDGASSKDESDGLVYQYIEFQKDLQNRYPDAEVSTHDVSGNWDIYEDWQLDAEITAYGGRTGKLVVNTLLTNSPKWVTSQFNERFDELTPDADFIIYTGHSGLSKNIRAIARKGVVKPRKYQIFMFYACSTFAYLDTAITERRKEVNGVEDDPDGTKYLDIIATAQPSYFYTYSDAYGQVVKLLAEDHAYSYLQMLDTMPQSAIPVVAGEEDNPTEAPPYPEWQ